MSSSAGGERLDGRTALVTGAGRGIGAAISTRLAALGALTYVSDLDGDSAAAVAETIPNAHSLALDVTDADQCAAAVHGIVDERERLDVLVACAGWVQTSRDIRAETPDYWRQVTAINFLGVVNACGPAFGAMAESGGGAIVTISSEAGRIGTPGQAVYAGCKGGVIAFTKSIAREGARHGVRANSVSPGVTATPLVQAQGEDVIARMVRTVPMRRLAEPEEIASAVTFLASDAAAFITGEVISVSGGLTMSS